MVANNETEVWKNVTRGRRGIHRVDAFGKVQKELVGPGKTVSITSEDRIHYQRIVASEKLDIFKNGAMVPVRILDEDTQREVAENPNLMSEEDLQNLMKAQWKKFESEIGKISTLYALERMRDIAESSEDISVKKYKIIADRIATVKEESAPTRVNEMLIKRAQRGY